MNTTTHIPAGSDEVVRLEDVRKVYGSGEGAVVALDGLTLGFESGSFTAVMGPSGSGKSTFLHIAAGLDVPTDGTAWLRGGGLPAPRPTPPHRPPPRPRRV